MKFQTMGLIVKEQNIGEQDKLVHALTATNGIIKAFVRGAKNIKNQTQLKKSIIADTLNPNPHQAPTATRKSNSTLAFFGN